MWLVDCCCVATVFPQTQLTFCIRSSAASQPNEVLVQRISGMTAEEIEKADVERKKQADKLMEEFLQARRKERAGQGPSKR